MMSYMYARYRHHRIRDQLRVHLTTDNVTNYCSTNSIKNKQISARTHTCMHVVTHKYTGGL